MELKQAIEQADKHLNEVECPVDTAEHVILEAAKRYERMRKDDGSLSGIERHGMLWRVQHIPGEVFPSYEHAFDALYGRGE